jgi:hypothetical protein
VPNARVAQGLASDTPQPVDQRPKIDPSIAAAHHFDTQESPPQAEGVAPPRGAMVGSLADCCSPAASGHAAAALPMRDMNSRRLYDGKGAL